MRLLKWTDLAPNLGDYTENMQSYQEKDEDTMGLAFDLKNDKRVREDKLINLFDIFLSQRQFRELGIVFIPEAASGLEVTPMDQLDVYPVLRSGGVLGVFLNSLRETNYSYGQLSRDLFGIEPSLQALCDLSLPLPHSKDIINEMLNWLENLVQSYGSQEQQLEIISDDDKNRIKRYIDRLLDRLRTELSESDLYCVSEKRIYTAKGLIFNADKMLPVNIVDKISEECARDIKEAGRALAFDLPTAAGFHISRALEAVILMYFPVLGLQPLEERMRSVGNYIRLLKGEKVGDRQIDTTRFTVVDNRIIGLLRYYKDEYRNPLMHPELALNEDEALDLFQTVLSTISMIVSDIVDRRSVMSRNLSVVST